MNTEEEASAPAVLESSAEELPAVTNEPPPPPPPAYVTLEQLGEVLARFDAIVKRFDESLGAVLSRCDRTDALVSGQIREQQGLRGKLAAVEHMTERVSKASKDASEANAAVTKVERAFGELRTFVEKHKREFRP